MRASRITEGNPGVQDRSSRYYAVLFCVVSAFGFGPSAWAESATSDTELRARELFQEGLGLADQGQWVQASDRFRRSLALLPSPAVRLNLASALSRHGYNAEAVDHLEEMIENEETPDNLRELARDLFRQLSPRTGSVALEISDVEGRVEVGLDGIAVADWRWRGLLHVEPGAHVLTITNNGQELTRREVVVTAGEARVIRYSGSDEPEEATPDPALELTPAAAAAATEPAEVNEPAAEEATTAPAEATSTTRRRPKWFLPVVIGGAVAVAAAITVGVVVGVAGKDDDIVEGNMEPGVWTWR